MLPCGRICAKVREAFKQRVHFTDSTVMDKVKQLLQNFTATGLAQDTKEALQKACVVYVMRACDVFSRAS